MLATALSNPLPAEPAKDAADWSGAVSGLQLLPGEEALSEILMRAIAAWGDGGLDLPWKCFVCVVSLSMLVPLAVNLALQVTSRVKISVEKVGSGD